MLARMSMEVMCIALEAIFFLNIAMILDKDTITVGMLLAVHILHLQVEVQVEPVELEVPVGLVDLVEPVA